ncbi:hypothetical protein QE152_g39828, partial [Popillia japonica]
IQCFGKISIMYFGCLHITPVNTGESDDDDYESYEELLSDEENVTAQTLNDEVSD